LLCKNGDITIATTAATGKIILMANQIQLLGSTTVTAQHGQVSGSGDLGNNDGGAAYTQQKVTVDAQLQAIELDFVKEMAIAQQKISTSALQFLVKSGAWLVMLLLLVGMAAEALTLALILEAEK
jgi:hypothetical protein